MAATLIGVHTPASNQETSDLDNMIYLEKPQIDNQAKALITKGDTTGALAIIKKFNNELMAQIKKTDIANGKSGSNARVQYYFNKDGLKMPGIKAMSNYQAKQGKSEGQKLLP